MAGLVLEPIAVDPDAGHDAVVLGASRANRWRTVAVAGAAVAIVAAVALVGRNGGGAAAPATTAPPTTEAPTSTSRTPRRASASYTEDQAFLNFLGVRSGVQLYGVVDDGSVVRMDLDSGTVAQRRLGRDDRGQRPQAIFARTGGAVIVAPDRAVSVGDGADGIITFLAAQDTEVFPAKTATEVWLVHTAGPVGRVAERRMVRNGAVNGTIPELPSGEVLGDDGTGALLVQIGAGVFRVTEGGGPPEPLSADPLVAWSAGALIEQRCDGGECLWDRVDRTSGDRRSLGAAPWGGSVLGAELSPDGTQLAYVGGIGGPTSPSVEVLDLATGQRTVLDHAVTLTRIPPSNGLVWSADGQWLFWVTDTGTLRAWQLGQERPQDVAGAGHIPALAAIALAS